MSRRIVVVGSGASGVHFALSALEKGHEVVMLDVGHRRPPPVRAADTLEELKTNLDDPVDFFLGPRFEAVIFPQRDSEYYGLPPTKTHVLEGVHAFDARATGFAPLLSFAEGGLAEAWTGGVYPFNDAELQDYPFSYHDIEPDYGEVARRIGIAGEQDDLTRFFPVHEHLLDPLELDTHSRRLLAAYERHRESLNHDLRCYLGRSRVSVLSGARHGRSACTYCGRCLWGCPSGAFYTPALTLEQCRRFGTFRYVGGVYVSHFAFDARRRITRVHAESTTDGTAYEWPVDSLVLAAGTLSSSKIFLESVYRGTGEVLTLSGLMDNQQVLVPFVNLGMLGTPYQPRSYQYHQLGMGLEAQDPRAYVHCQITTLKTATVHPIIQSLPFDLRTSTALFRHLRSALGVVNVNFHDTRRAENRLTLEPRPHHARSPLLIEYRAAPGERAAIQTALRRVMRALWKLRCVAPPSMVHVRPKGASVHYSGTIPMSASGESCTTDETCRSHDFENLYLVDGTTFPFLPAKNITFTLMANAVRVARIAF